MATQIGTAIEVVESRSGGGDINTGDSYETRKYKVQFTDTSANSIDARNGSGVPAYGNQLGSYELYLHNKEAVVDRADQRWWMVTVTYRTLKAFEQQPNFDNSSIWNIIKNAVPYPYEIALQKDVRTGKPIVNVFGEPVRPPLVRVKYDYQINISFLTNALDTTNLDAQSDTVNGSTISITIGGEAWTFAAETLLFQAATVQETFDADGALIAQVSIPLIYRKDTWLQRIPNTSFYRTGDSDNNYNTTMPILDFNHQPVNEPRYLDGYGQPLADGDDIFTNDFWVNTTSNFDTLLSGLI